MRQLVRQRQGLVEVRQGLRWVPQHPESQRGIGSAGNPRIVAHAEHWRTALVGRVAGEACLQVLAGLGQRAQAEPRPPKGIVGDDRERRVVRLLRQAPQRVPELVPRVQLRPQHIKPPQPKQHWDQLWGPAYLLIQRVGLGVCMLHLGRGEPFGHLQSRAEGDVEGQCLLGMLRCLWQGREQLDAHLNG
jgi:hypothetical protein